MTGKSWKPARRVEDRLVLAAERDRVVDADHAADPVAPRTARVDDDARRDLAVTRYDTRDAPVHGRDAEHLAALVGRAVRPCSADRTSDSTVSTGSANPDVGSWHASADSVEPELRPAAGRPRPARGAIVSTPKPCCTGDHLAQAPARPRAARTACSRSGGTRQARRAPPRRSRSSRRPARRA